MKILAGCLALVVALTGCSFLYADIGAYAEKCLHAILFHYGSHYCRR
jgi:hypothetical protein